MRNHLALAFALALSACAESGAPEPSAWNIGNSRVEPVSVDTNDNGNVVAIVKMDMKSIPRRNLRRCFIAKNCDVVSEDGTAYNIGDITRDENGLLVDMSGEPITGVVKSNYPDGSPKSETYIRDGRLHGNNTTWNEDGSRASVDVFDGGVRASTFVYWPNDRLHYAVDYDGREINMVYMYDEDGDIVWSSGVVDGRLEGAYKLYSDGAIAAEFEMRGNAIVGGEIVEDGKRRDATADEIAAINASLGDSAGAAVIAPARLEKL